MIKPTDLFVTSSDLVTRGHRYKIQIQHSNTEARRRFFSNRVAPLWNSLPENVVDAPSLNTFKIRLHNVMADQLFDYEE